MNVLITGGTGFVGSALSGYLLDHGHQVTALGTREKHPLPGHEQFRYVRADTTQPGSWQNELNETDAVVNFAGRSIFKRWTRSYKRQIYDSRILTTRHVAAGLPQDKGIVFLSASAAGYYGSRGDETITEAVEPGKDFLASLCREWEREANGALDKHVRLVTVRLGIVLDAHGGAIKKMIPPFRYYVGGPLGNGRQWFPWIHMQDLLSAIGFILENEKVNGPLNVCSPHPVQNKDLARTIGKILHKPAFFPVPSIMLRMMLGEFSGALLSSQRMLGDKLISHGFKFRYPDIQSALNNILLHG